MRTIAIALTFAVMPCALPAIDAPLTGTSWKLVKISYSDDKTHTPPESAKYTLEFLDSGRVSAQIDCNRGNGTWKSEAPGKISFGEMATTRAMCPPGSLFDNVVRDLPNFTSYVIKDGKLFLSLKADGGIYEYAALSGGASTSATGDPLPSWNDTSPKKAIVVFVEKVTKDGSADFVPVPERIAVFDNDGTLWGEQPAYFQLLFIFDRVKALAANHPEWKEKEPFASVLKGDMKAVAAQGEKGAMALLAATHTGMTTEEFTKTVEDWIATAKHPKSGRLYTEMVYQPMLELLAYLRANGFKTFIVSGGGIEFMRPWTERVYGIPPEQVVGSSGKLKLEERDGKLVLVKTPEINLIDDKEGKPVGIQMHIGRRPIAAFGNSDGDLQMLQWTTEGKGARFGLIVHHTDDAREVAYDRQSHFGKLDKALDEAATKGWTVVSMKDDWKVIYPTQK
jgi:heat shock protein HslJ/phosphoglycolate phosphatase-like HAD superfamily hydrolase